MLPTIITFCVIAVCGATATFILLNVVAWVGRWLRPRRKYDHQDRTPPDLFQ